MEVYLLLAGTTASPLAALNRPERNQSSQIYYYVMTSRKINVETNVCCGHPAWSVQVTRHRNIIWAPFFVQLRFQLCQRVTMCRNELRSGGFHKALCHYIYNPRTRTTSVRHRSTSAAVVDATSFCPSTWACVDVEVGITISCHVSLTS